MTVEHLEPTVVRRMLLDGGEVVLVNVRSPEEHAQAHLARVVSAPGGQLVECSDDWIGIRDARIVLLDDDSVRYGQRP